MSIIDLEILLIAVTVAAACALPGVFLILRRTALMSDAISHAMLLGIVLAFFVTGEITSPFLVVAAALTGLLTVVLVEFLHASELVKKDAAIGLVFPALFSLAVILISRHAGNVHLDTDAVLLGELAFTPFRRLLVFGVDIGPRTLYVMLGILLLNVAFLTAFFKEMKLTTFDPGLAAALGFAPMLLNYAFMFLVSMTTVGSFDAVGAILVVALMIAPPAAAYLLTDRLPVMITLSVGIGILSAITGYGLAQILDGSIAGAMATMTGVLFVAALLLAPERGLIVVAHRRQRQRLRFAGQMLAIHILHHQGGPDELVECREDHLCHHLRWSAPFAHRVVRYAEQKGIVTRGSQGLLHLTDRGRSVAREAMVQ